MPREKRRDTQTTNLKLLEAISGSSAFFCLSPDQQAAIAHLSRSTWYRRLRHPETFTINELRLMASKYKWSDDVILQIVRYSG